MHMQIFSAVIKVDSLNTSDLQLIEGIAPIAFLLFGVGILSWVIEIITNFRR